MICSDVSHRRNHWTNKIAPTAPDTIRPGRILPPQLSQSHAKATKPVTAAARFPTLLGVAQINRVQRQKILRNIYSDACSDEKRNGKSMRAIS